MKKWMRKETQGTDAHTAGKIQILIENVEFLHE